MSKLIRDRIRELAQSSNVQIQAAQVSAINETERTISVLFDDELEMSNVRLTSTIDDNDSFIVHYPKLGSDVLIAEIEEGFSVVLMVSEIEKTHIKSKDFEMVIENGNVAIASNKIEINGGVNKGIVKVEPLDETLKSITAWMKSIDAIIRSSVLVTSAPGTPDVLQAALKIAIAANQVPTVPNLENSKITH